MNPASEEILDDEQETQLRHDLDRWANAACASCRGSLCGHHVVMSVVLGFKDAPRCLDCLSSMMRQSSKELHAQLVQHLYHRPCYRRGWEIACDREGFPRTPTPPCLVTEGAALARACDRAVAKSEPVAVSPEENAAWDAGEMACGDLVLALRGRIASLPEGGVLRVTAHDPAAPEDLPAWCRLTGNPLQQAQHPVYFIQRKKG